MLPLRGSGQVYLTCAFAPDGQSFAAGGLGHAVEVWDLTEPGRVAWEIDTDRVAAVFAGYTPDGQLVVARGHGALHLVPPRGEIASCWLLPSSVTRAALSADGSRLVTSGDQVTTWAVGPEFRELAEVRCGPGEILTGVAISPDGLRIASGRIAADGGAVVEVLDATTGDFVHLIPVDGRRPDKLAWSADGRFLAGLVDMHVTVWETATWTEVLSPLEDPGRGTGLSVAFHPTGNFLLTGTTRGDVTILDPNTWGPLTKFRWGTGPVYALAVAPDGLRAAAAGHTGAVLWDLDV
jgi:WD40 repeat protein